MGAAKERHEALKRLNDRGERYGRIHPTSRTATDPVSYFMFGGKRYLPGEEIERLRAQLPIQEQKKIKPVYVNNGRPSRIH